MEYNSRHFTDTHTTANGDDAARRRTVLTRRHVHGKPIAHLAQVHVDAERRKGDRIELARLREPKGTNHTLTLSWQ